MDRTKLMEAIEKGSFDARIGLRRLCVEAGISPTVIYRWQRRQITPTLETIGKLERTLDQLREQAA